MKESNANENVSWKKTQLHRFSVENLSLAKQVNFTWNCRNAAIKIRDFDGLNIIVASCSRRNSESISLLYLADGNYTEAKWRTAREARFFCNVLCYCDVNAAVFANALDSNNYEIDM